MFIGYKVGVGPHVYQTRAQAYGGWMIHPLGAQLLGTHQRFSNGPKRLYRTFKVPLKYILTFIEILLGIIDGFRAIIGLYDFEEKYAP